MLTSRDNLITATIELSEAILARLGAKYDEAAGAYYYDIVRVKRWALGDGGRSGNCALCVGNADDGWIGEDAMFSSGDTEPEAHPNCGCVLEYKDAKKRVYLLPGQPKPVVTAPGEKPKPPGGPPAAPEPVSPAAIPIPPGGPLVAPASPGIGLGLGILGLIWPPDKKKPAEPPEKEEYEPPSRKKRRRRRRTSV